MTWRLAEGASRPVVQLVMNEVAHDPRVRRIGRTLRDAGYPVVFCGWSDRDGRVSHGFVEAEPVDGIPRYLLHAPMGRLPGLAMWGARAAWVARVWSAMWRGLGTRPRLVHAHDLQAFRFVAHAASARRVPVVYDSHELERGRNSPNWSPTRHRLHALSERATIGRAAAVITVAPSIADVLAESYGIERPLVLVNSHPRAHVRPNVPLGERLGLSPEDRVVLYLGGLTAGRGLEPLVRALPSLSPRVHLALVGPMRPEWEGTWEQLLASVAEVRERIHHLGAVPYEEVIHQAWGAHVGFNGLDLACESYRHALPNKLLEYAFAGVPVLSTRSLGAVMLIEQYGIGRLYEDGDDASLVEALRSMTEQPMQVRSEDRERLVEDYCWDNQARALLSLYSRLVGDPP